MDKKGNFHKLIRNLRMKKHEKIKIHRVADVIDQRQDSQKDNIRPEDDSNKRSE